MLAGSYASQTPDSCADGYKHPTNVSTVLTVVGQSSTVANIEIRDQITVADGASCAGFPVSAVSGYHFAYGNPETVPGCPAGSTASEGVCSCPAGKRPSGGACVDYTCPSGQPSYFSSSSPIEASANCDMDSGCVWEDMASATTTSESGVKRYFGQSSFSGAKCEGAGTGGASAEAPVPAPATSAADKCALGNGPPMCASVINGITVCVSCAASSSTTSEKSDTPASGTSPATGTTKTTTTECGANGCTTTTTTKDASGNVTGTTSSTKPKDDDKPDPSAFGGSCQGAAAAITCAGDAVQCAIAREQYRRNCEIFDNTNSHAQAALGAISAGTAGDQDHPRRDGSSSALTFDQTDLIGGSCPGDRVLGVGKTQVTLKFSELCTAAGWLGNLLVGLTSLACIGIVFKQG